MKVNKIRSVMISLSQEPDSEMRKRLRLELISIAKKRNTMSYSDLALKLGIKDAINWYDIIGYWLGKISEEEVNNNGPMLSAVVINNDTEIPGNGFFILAYKLGIMKNNERKEDFLKKELEKVWNYAQTHS